MELFTAKNIIKAYSSHVALDDVSVSVSQGSIFGLLGPNGAGKTSLIRIINQITAPDSGSLFFKGVPMSQIHIEKIGYLPEERGLYKQMAVGEQALYLAQLKGMKRHDALQRLKYWFEKFEIEAWWNKKVEELSKGMQQKVQFITTILHQPELLIFDEPFSGFDPINANMIKGEILDLKRNGSTIIFSTHNMASVEELCDDIALIHKAKVYLSGNVRDIRRNHRTNIYQVDFEECNEEVIARLKQKYSRFDVKSDGEFLSAIVSVDESLTANDLLGQLIPDIRIHLFKEIVPSMNEIFIKTVGGDPEAAQSILTE